MTTNLDMEVHITTKSCVYCVDKPLEPLSRLTAREDTWKVAPSSRAGLLAAVMEKVTEARCVRVCVVCEVCV